VRPTREANVSDRIEELLERAAILEIVNALFIGTDNRDWPAVKKCFAPSVRFDMSSAGAGEPTVKTPDEIAAMWDVGLKPLKAVHHQVGNFVVSASGSHATVFCYGIAGHYLPNASGRNTRTFVGSYDFGLERHDGRWRISSFKFNLKYLDGNLDLENAPTPQEAERSIPRAATLSDFLLQEGFRQIPLSVSGVGHLHAAGTLNGRSVSVLLDTGGASTVVHLGLAREMGLELDKMPFQGGGAGAAKLDVYQLRSAEFRMRDVRPRLRALLAMDLKHVNEALALKGQPAVDIIVGADVFEGHAAVIDYGSHSVFLKS
jgi:hypothetical protein